MKSTRDLIEQNQDMHQDNLPRAYERKWNPRTRQYEKPLPKDQIVKSPNSF